MHAGTLRRQLVRVAITAITFSIGGCALPRLDDPEQAEYQRIDSELRTLDEYAALKRSCRERGGVLYLNGSSSRIRPVVPDLTTARCTAPFPGVRF